ncbi:MAG: alpha/beta hydrolase family protein [Bryobacteraceae bacterium]
MTRYLLFALSLPLFAQTTAPTVAARMSQPLHNAEVVAFQARQYVVRHVPRLKPPESAEAWTAEAKRLREKVLRDVVFHGWPAELVNSPPRFEDLGLIPAGKGYRLRKLRYRVAPGFSSVALLYEPENLSGKVPAILNVNGHEAEGKSMEYIQKRCINQARQGMLALNLEWIGMGELKHRENLHWWASHLDLVGLNGLGLFYLEMRKGLDFLWDHPNVDRARVGITGLSGGGWQTAVLSGLDERIAAAIPNAGYHSGLTYAGRDNIGDNEQSATDFLGTIDYAHIAAMRAPKPTLMIYNAEDNCCFRAPKVKPFLFDLAAPVYRLFGAEDRLVWYENTDPGDHNYQLDNRMQSYRFFARQFGLPAVETEMPADADIKTAEELTIGLPPDQLTMLGLARQFAEGRKRREFFSHQEARNRLIEVIRYRPAKVTGAWPLENGNRQGLESVGYRLDFDNGLSATAVWFRALTTPRDAPMVFVLHDAGKKEAAALVSDRVNRGEQVVAFDPIFSGDADTPKFSYPNLDRMLNCVGERSAGLRAAQLAGAIEWFTTEKRPARVRIDSTGPRTEISVVSLVALKPGLVTEATIRKGLGSIDRVLALGLNYVDYPEVFVLDFQKEFDYERLGELARPAQVRWVEPRFEPAR